MQHTIWAAVLQPVDLYVSSTRLDIAGRGMQLGNFEYTATPLALGASGGNQFELTLRDVNGASTDQVSHASPFF